MAAKKRNQTKTRKTSHARSRSRSAATARNRGSATSRPTKVRYAVVGLGHIAQNAVLPAFRNVANSKLVALVSSNQQKLKKLAKAYGVGIQAGYEDYDRLLASGDVDAVMIALPNHLHAEYTVRAADAGVHVLCEKPMAVTSDDCRWMIRACERARTKLMIAYRLHFEPSNMAAVEVIESGEIGEPRLMHGSLTFSVEDAGNIRLSAPAGGGPLLDIGLYPLNASRYLFQAEPIEVTALAAAAPDDPRFDEVPEMHGVALRFPGERLAVFTCSFGAADSSQVEVLGTEGMVRVENAFDYAEPRNLIVKVGEKTRRKRFRKQDQFGPEIEYFSRCVLEDAEPEPSGLEGLIDVAIVEAIEEAARTGRTIRPRLPERKRRPGEEQADRAPAVEPKTKVQVRSPHGE